MNVITIIFVVITTLYIFISLFLIRIALARKSNWYNRDAQKLFSSNFGNREDLKYQQIRLRQKNEGNTFWNNNYTSDVTIDVLGETLWAREFRRYPNSHHWVICVHGYRHDGKSDMAFPASKYSTAGFNVLVPDLGAHGKSSGKKIGMGWLEKNQIEEWTQYVIQSIDKKAEIILFGGSMGAATIMMLSGDNVSNQVKLLIADCGYTSIYDEFSYLLKKAVHFPVGPILFFTQIFFRIYMGFSLKEASCIKQLKKNERPILFIHGTRDKFVPFSDMAINFTATKGIKERLIVENAPHLSSWIYEEEIYFEAVFSFIEKNF